MLGPHKAVAAVTVDTAAGPLVVATTHLTSDHTDDGAAPAAGRAGPDSPRGWPGWTADVVAAGRLQRRRDGRTARPPRSGMRDAWTEAHGPGDDTPTFDPARQSAGRGLLLPAGRPGWTGCCCAAGLRVTAGRPAR